MKATTIGMIGFFLTTVLYFSKTRDLKQSNATLTNDYNVLDSLYMETAERALNYQLIAFELNEITDRFQSSRMEKLRRKDLIDKMAMIK